MRHTIATCAVLALSIARGQDILDGPVPGQTPILQPGDSAVLEAGETRKDLACAVTPEKPLLGFDLRFHTGFMIAVPLKELEGRGDALSIIFRVIPRKSARTVYFKEQIRVPSMQDANGQVNLEGSFDVGEGSYHVDWLMRNFSGRYCATSWDVDAALDPKDKQVAVALPPNAIERSTEEEFQPEPPVARAANAPLNVKLLLNFAPQHENSAALDPAETAALVSIVRNISRSPQIGRISLVVFNVQEQRVLYKQASSDHLDFPAMGRALKNLNLGTVDVGQLERRHGDTEFLANLVKNELGDGGADGLIFVGPKTLVDSSVSPDDLRQIGDPGFPVFYLNYTLDPYAVPWKDAISRMVKFFKGREYTISGPRDLWNAVTEAVTRMTRSKQSRSSVPTGLE